MKGRIRKICFLSKSSTRRARSTVLRPPVLTYKLRKMTIAEAIRAVLEEMTKRKPTPMEVLSMAQNIEETIEAEIDARIAKALNPPTLGF